MTTYTLFCTGLATRSGSGNIGGGGLEGLVEEGARWAGSGCKRACLVTKW